MVGSSTIDTTGNFCWAVVAAVSSRAKAMRTACVSRFIVEGRSAMHQIRETKDTE
jgi:hypothetical protein